MNCQIFQQQHGGGTDLSSDNENSKKDSSDVQLWCLLVLHIISNSIFRKWRVELNRSWVVFKAFWKRNTPTQLIVAILMSQTMVIRFHSHHLWCPSGQGLLYGSFVHLLVYKKSSWILFTVWWKCNCSSPSKYPIFWSKDMFKVAFPNPEDVIRQ